MPPDLDPSISGRLHDLGGGVAQLCFFASALLSLRVIAFAHWLPLSIREYCGAVSWSAYSAIRIASG